MNKFKPNCELIGQDGNIFNLLAIAVRTLRKYNMKSQAEEMSKRVFNSKSYDEALIVIDEYVNIIGSEHENQMY